MSTTVEDAPTRHRYEVEVDGETAGHVVYRQVGDVRTFVHTEVDDRFQGRGVASELVRAAIDDTLAHGLTIAVTCPYVTAWLNKHPDVARAVAASAGTTPDSA